MVTNQNQSTLQELVAEMVTLENKVKEALGQIPEGVLGHAGAMEAITSFRAKAVEHQEALDECFQRINAGDQLLQCALDRSLPLVFWGQMPR